MSSRCKRKRRGVILIGVFLCLMAVVLINTSLLRSTALERRQLRTESRLIQCNWLVSSGMRRAVKKLRKQRDYGGEQWSIPESTLAGQAKVDILVQTVSGQPNQRRISVQAQYPIHPVSRAVRKKTWIVQLDTGAKQ